MSAALTTIPTDSVAVQIRAMQERRAWIGTATAVDAAEMARHAATARKVIAALRESETLLIEATRLEMCALRRLGQLDQATKRNGLTNVQVRSAETFALVPDEEWVTLVESVGGVDTSGKKAEAVRGEWAKWQGYRDLARIASGQIVCPTYWDRKALRDEARCLLDSLRTSESAFNVGDAARQLADRLGVDDFDGIVQEGLEELVRHAIRNDVPDPKLTTTGPPSGRVDHNGHGRELIGLPSFVTYQEGDHGWVRVPITLASVGQFRVMVELREAQARDLVAAAEALRSDLYRLEDLGCRDCDRVADVVRGDHR